MKSLTLTIVYIILTWCSLMAQDSCLTHENLKQLDASWEKAQLELDMDVLKNLLAEEFIWVHNHASSIDNKSDVLNRVTRGLKNKQRNTRSRISEKVQAIVDGSTGIVHGYTTVDRGPKPTKYHFMRTYITKNERCLLLANHTMAIPDE